MVIFVQVIYEYQRWLKKWNCKWTIQDKDIKFNPNQRKKKGRISNNSETHVVRKAAVNKNIV